MFTALIVVVFDMYVFLMRFWLCFLLFLPVIGFLLMRSCCLFLFIKVNGYRCYLWAAIDVDSRELLAVYVSMGRSMINALIFLKRFLEVCENKPVMVVDRSPCYPWTLKKLGIEYLHETFEERNRIERWFRKQKDSTT